MVKLHQATFSSCTLTPAELCSQLLHPYLPLGYPCLNVGPSLQDSLSGDSKTLMVVNVNPTESDAGETACSLGFASRVRGVELGPARKHIEAGAEVQELKAQLDALRQQVIELQKQDEHIHKQQVAHEIS